MNCPNCGKQIPDNTVFCGNCGVKIETQSAQVRQTVQQPVTEATLPAKYRPLSPWSYFGLSLLFSIPVVGFVFLIVFSCSGANINRRNFARSYWCMLILCVIILAILFAVALLTRGGEALVGWIQSL